MRFGIVVREAVNQVKGKPDCGFTEFWFDIVSEVELPQRIAEIIKNPKLCSVSIYTEYEFDIFCEAADYEPSICEPEPEVDTD